MSGSSYTSLSRSSKRATRLSRISLLAPSANSSRTTGWKRRCRTCSSTSSLMLLSLSSSIAMSALRETRNSVVASISTPGNRLAACDPDQFLQRDEAALRRARRRRAPAAIAAGAVGTLTRTRMRSAGLGVLEHEAPGRRQVRHERERMRRIEAQRRQCGRNVALEILASLRRCWAGVSVAPGRESHAVTHQALAQFGEAFRAAQQHADTALHAGDGCGR